MTETKMEIKHIINHRARLYARFKHQAGVWRVELIRDGRRVAWTDCPTLGQAVYVAQAAVRAAEKRYGH